MTIMSFASFGYEGEIIKVEADLRRGLPIIDIVGLPGSAVKEARERMRAAIGNSDLPFPQERILINLSPADQKKEGSGFDLPIALAVLQAECALDMPVMVIGELELSGRVRPVRGVLGALISGSAAGIEYFIVPKENEAEARIQQGVRIFGVETLREALECLYAIEAELRVENNSESNGGDKNSGAPAREAIGHTGNSISTAASWSEPSQADAAANTGTGGFFEEVYGQGELIRALHIAAAGGHSVLAYGPPGCGKTLSMQRFASLLPDLDPKTAEEVTHIYSIAGLLPSMRGHDVRIKRPPFRMPHPNASLEGMIGGAGKCMPGEISLAHGGTLFLDEAVQFKQTVLQTLRAPLETGTVTLSRAGRATTFPARFQLLMALNSCPCGNLGADGKVCTCMPAVVEQYWKKLTAPLIDRIDLRIPVFPTQAYGLPEKPCYNTADMRKKIAASDNIQRERYAAYMRKGLSGGAAAGTPVHNKTVDSNLAGTAQSAAQLSYKNVHLTPSALSALCPLTGEAERIFTHNAEKRELSGRGSHATLKIARTIADLAQEEVIAAPHIEEAIRLREWSSFLPFFMH
ncbi:YifB family Mg chelatase-like AAA ATPase [Treponema sp. OMZ 857]|uniref:YifB family Mg chelatase-like AAA ATPase n=1 Tax=Treponema sp. OMZ 857 TaxID=1643513 RepID=UPI0020A47FD3|nr:ATP-binding protein [Treponema sp. OMZ 857]UTC43901.1 ATP-binding protein [Treponema sp. OMZ 857]